jgi:hypothetical protein
MYSCLLCNGRTVHEDDAATRPTAAGTVICVRCWQAEIGDGRPLHSYLRAEVESLLSQIARELGVDGARCFACDEAVGRDVTALFLDRVGWFCAHCWDSPTARAVAADPTLAARIRPSDAEPAPPFRCIVCERPSGRSVNLLYNLNRERGLTVCAECGETPLGKKLEKDFTVRNQWLRALGLIEPEAQPPASESGGLGSHADESARGPLA